MRVSVTQEDIGRGIPGSPFFCAVARALSRAAGGEWWVLSSQAGRCGGVAVDLPLRAQAFVRNFDGEQACVGPFEFDLNTEG